MNTNNAEQKTLYLFMEISGCPSACMHCWAQGRPYPPMAISDIEWVLDQGARFCRSEGLRFFPTPMHEILTHPQALQLSSLFFSYNHEIMESRPIAGQALAARSDWEEIVRLWLELGTNSLRFAFHGMNDAHDRVVSREGAFAELVTAIERAKSVGFRCTTNLFVTSLSAPQIPDTLRFLSDIGIDELCAEVVSYSAHPRGRAYEQLRPTLEDLLPYAQALANATDHHKDFWLSIDRHTEGHYVREALARHEAQLQWPRPETHRIPVFCTTNLDLHSGKAPTNSRCRGNLRTGDPQAAFAGALNAWPPRWWPELYFPDIDVPPIPNLVSQCGDPDGRRVYPDQWNLYTRLVDVAFGNPTISAGANQ